MIACRRLLVIAYEDIGLGNPQAMERTLAAVTTAEKLGLPEGRIPLSYAVAELALSPKSNTTYRAINQAMQDVQHGRIGPVPEHIRDSHYSGAEKLGHGIGYKYPHDYDGSWVYQQYLPDAIKDREYFHPKANSKYEEALEQLYKNIRQHSAEK